MFCWAQEHLERGAFLTTLKLIFKTMFKNISCSGLKSSEAIRFFSGDLSTKTFMLKGKRV